MSSPNIPISFQITDADGTITEHQDGIPHIKVTLPSEDKEKKCGPSISAREWSEGKLGPNDNTATGEEKKKAEAEPKVKANKGR
jgi:hypothetical protein